jgi:hypothetical protein
MAASSQLLLSQQLAILHSFLTLIPGLSLDQAMPRIGRFPSRSIQLHRESIVPVAMLSVQFK